MSDIQIDSPKRDYMLPASILMAALLISGSLIYNVGNKSELNQNGDGQADLVGVAKKIPVISESEAVLGENRAKVELIEYGDYQCPYCTKFFKDVQSPLEKDLVASGKVKMVFRNFQFLGPESIAAANAAMCAKDQNKFWEYHNALYTAEMNNEANGGGENDNSYNRALFLSLAGKLSLDTSAFASCLDTNKYANQVNQETKAAQTLGINGTPTVFVNGKKIEGVGVYDYDTVKSLIEQAK